MLLNWEESTRNHARTANLPQDAPGALPSAKSSNCDNGQYTAMQDTESTPRPHEPLQRLRTATVIEQVHFHSQS